MAKDTLSTQRSLTVAVLPAFCQTCSISLAKNIFQHTRCSRHGVFPNLLFFLA